MRELLVRIAVTFVLSAAAGFALAVAVERLIGSRR